MADIDTLVEQHAALAAGAKAALESTAGMDPARRQTFAARNLRIMQEMGAKAQRHHGTKRGCKSALTSMKSDASDVEALLGVKSSEA